MERTELLKEIHEHIEVPLLTGEDIFLAPVSGLRKQTQQYDRSNGWAIDLRTCCKSY